MKLIKTLGKFKWQLKTRIKELLKVNRVKNHHLLTKYFTNKVGLEIGGPSKAFQSGGYISVYNKVKTLDGVNFSDTTIWTGKINAQHGFIVNKKRVGKMYIADATALTEIENAQYDFILSSNNIEHIANPLKAMEQWISKLKINGILVIVAPRKESNFDHKRNIVKIGHLLDDYNQDIDECDLTHLDDILQLHDFERDYPSSLLTFSQFKERCLKNFEHRWMHHHCFDLKVLEQMCNYFDLKVILKEEKPSNYIIVAQKTQ